MIDLAMVQRAVRHSFERSTGLPFIWQNASNEFIEKPYGLLSFGASASPERDNVYTTDVGGNVTEVIVGAREFTINVQVHSRSHEPEGCARHFLERARTLLRFEQHRQVLAFAGLVLHETHPIVDLDVVFQQRHESRAAFDLVFRALEVEYDPIGIPDFFTRVDLRNEVKAA
jgi:hypothetical protein